MNNTMPQQSIEYIDVVMTTLPGPDGEFVETEDDTGRGVGQDRGLSWVNLDDGFYRLRIPATAFTAAPDDAAAHLAAVEAREAHDRASGEVWGWLNRHDAPWSPSDATVSDLAWRIVAALSTADPD